MPRENRKRGKKHKKQRDTVEDAPVKHYDEEQQAGPSWIVDPNPEAGYSEEGTSRDAPFGYVDPDVKAYFKTVDAKLREWQESDSVVNIEESAELNEERRLFLVAALAELSGKEKQLATDPDCSNIMERMAYSMDDFVKRVLFDRLAGSYEQLARHRFGSHVVQTLLSVARGTIVREAKGQRTPAPDSDETDGVLRSLTQLVLDLSDELLPLAPNLVMDPFASHVLRALLVLLCPELIPADDASASSLLRSKKSAKHRAKQGPMKSVFVSEDADERQSNGLKMKGKKKATALEAYPPEFNDVARRFVACIREEMDANEVRALAANKIACPVLIMLLELEALQNGHNKAGSLMDSVSAGLVASCLESPGQKMEPSDFVATLMRDPASSRLLEALVSLSPESVFNMLWETYFEGKLSKLAVHPVASFVVARAIGRLTDPQLTAAIKELEGTWPKFIKNARLNAMMALINRSAELGIGCADILDAVYDAFCFKTDDKKDALVMCALHMKIYTEYSKLPKQPSEEDGSSKSPFEPGVPGSLLIQSLLRLPEPQNKIITDSIIALPTDQLLALAQHPVSSHIVNALLESSTVLPRTRRRLILAFQDHFHTLVDDRNGSFVGEHLWAAADPYLKEKIARALVPHESRLRASQYGKYFVRGLNLYLLKRDPEEWKAAMVKAGVKEEAKSKPKPTIASSVPVAAVSASAEDGAKGTKPNRHDKKRKRAEKGEDEIDVLFSSALGKKQRKANLALPDAADDIVSQEAQIKPSKPNDVDDKDLAAVLGAIQSAPKELKGGKKVKKKR